MPGRSLLFIIVGLVAGILIGSRSDLPVWTAVVPVLAAVVLFIRSIALTKRNPFSPTGVNNEILVVSLFLGIGIFSGSLSRPATLELPSGDCRFSGIVEDYEVKNYGDRLLVSLSSLKDKTGCKYNVRNVRTLVTLREATDISYGDHIEGWAYFSPYDAKGNYLKKDYEDYLKSRNILITGVIGKYELKKSDVFSFKSLRDRLESIIEASQLNPQTRDFLISFLLGDKTVLNRSDRLVFADAGISHVFAVSGFHVNILAMLMLGILALFFRGSKRRLKFLVALPLIWFYILLTGGSPATMRAGIMLTIGLTALFLQRRNNPLKALAWAAILILSFNAAALYDIGFQLSVVCVGSLILIAEPLNFINHRSHPRIFKLVSATLVTLTATFSTWLICAFYFHRFSLMFLPLNLLALPLLPIYVILALSYLALFNVGLAIGPLKYILDEGYALFRDGATFITSRATSYENLYPGVITVFIWLGALCVLGYTLRRFPVIKRSRAYGMLGFSAALFSISVLTLVFIPASSPNGFIIRKSQIPSLMVYDDGKESTLTLPEAGSALVALNGKKIISLHSENLPEEITDADIIMLCNGCRSLPSGLPEKALLVTHPSLHWQYERRILAEAEECNLKTHSLRYDGPFHYFSL